MNDDQKLVNAVLKDLDRAVSAKDLCDAVRDARVRRWRSRTWNRIVTEEQIKLDVLMREANMAKVGRTVNA